MIVDNEAVVWIIDSEHWPRACLRAELRERGFDAVGYTEIEQALQDLQRPYSSKPCLIVLELRQQSLKDDELMAMQETRIPIVALSGLTEFNEPTVQEFPWTAILRRPFTISEVADLVEKTIGSQRSGARIN